MKMNLNKLNKACLFHDFSQGDEAITKMMCTFYAPLINAKYNGIIKDFTEDDIKEIAKIQIENNLFSIKNGGKGLDGVNAIIKWLKDKKNITCDLAILETDQEVKEWLNRGFAVITGIKVNEKFWSDKQDYKIDETEYSNFKGSIGHFTNLIKWTCRGTFDCGDVGNEYILDSYFVKNSTIKVNMKEVLQHIDMHTKYVIF